MAERKAENRKKRAKPAGTRKELLKLESEVSQVIKNERRIESKENTIEKLQGKELSEEKHIARVDTSEVDELKKMEQMEKELRKSGASLLGRITYQDFIKSAIGALIGVVGGFTFALSPGLFLNNISLVRAHMLFGLSFAMVILFVYFSGFRKVREIRNWGILPVRALVIYITSILTVVIVMLIFGILEKYSLAQAYILVSATSVIAVLGACAADMLGGD